MKGWRKRKEKIEGVEGREGYGRRGNTGKRKRERGRERRTCYLNNNLTNLTKLPLERNLPKK
jgi:hypothetical protein